MSVRHIVVMGTAGSGKTTVGRALAEALDVPFAEGDEFHSDANRAKMAAGIPLTDDDRWPWLASLRDWMIAKAREGTGSVVACSALRRAYRDVLREAEGDVVFVHPEVAPGVIAERMNHREGHYMPTSLLASQLATLEELGPDERGVVIDAGADAGSVVRAALAALDTLPPA